MNEVRDNKTECTGDKLLRTLDEAKTLASDIVAENCRLKSELEQKDQRDNVTLSETKSEIADKIAQWYANANLILRTEVGVRSVVANKIKRKELFQTSFGAILATSENVRDQFESYVDNGSLMDANKLAVRYGLTTRFAINKACKRGIIERIDCFGSAIALFVV